MKITLSKSELRERLRLLAGLEPEYADCAVEYTDGLSINELLDSKLRAWYLDLLDHGEFSLLAPAEMASAARCSEGPAGGSSVTLPAMCRRVAAVRLEGWTRAVDVLPVEAVAAVVRRQSNPFLAATPDSPVAVVAPGSSDGAISCIFAWPPSDTAETLTVVLDTGPDSYTFDESALGLLEKLVEHLNII